jgi:nucleoside-diphosphate-sugar epimerase
MKILLTGAAGFIGKNIMTELLKKGHEVIIFDRLFGEDLSDQEILDQNIEIVDQVVHLAAIADLNFAREHPDQTFESNIRGTWNVAELCAKHKKRLLYASTCCVYGDQDFEKYPETTEDAPPNPNEIYAYSKYIGELLIKSLHFTHGLAYVNMRFPTVTGEPGQREVMGVKIFFRQAMQGVPITVHGTGEQTRTITNVHDLVECVIKLIERPDLNNFALNMSTNESVSALQMAETIKDLVGSTSIITHIAQRPGQTMHEAINSSKAKELLGWEAKMSFRDSMAQVYESLKKEQQ